MNRRRRPRFNLLLLPATRGELQGYLAHEKPPPPLGLPWERMHGSPVGSYGVAVSYERGTPVGRACLGAGGPERGIRRGSSLI